MPKPSFLPSAHFESCTTTRHAIRPPPLCSTFSNLLGGVSPPLSSRVPLSRLSGWRQQLLAKCRDRRTMTTTKRRTSRYLSLSLCLSVSLPSSCFRYRNPQLYINLPGRPPPARLGGGTGEGEREPAASIAAAAARLSLTPSCSSNCPPLLLALSFSLSLSLSFSHCSLFHDDGDGGNGGGGGSCSDRFNGACDGDQRRDERADGARTRTDHSGSIWIARDIRLYYILYKDSTPVIVASCAIKLNF